MKPIFIKATTLSDAWHQAVFKTVDCGTTRITDQGSYEGERRLECDHVTIQITHPHVTPLVPKLNPAFNIPDPVGDDYVNSYIAYLMIDDIQECEEYTYGQRIADQIDKVIEKYKKYGHSSNQHILQVGQPEDIELKNPPCLRHIDTVIKDGKLHFFPYFRSWDLWGGFPANLAGIELLKQFMAEEIGVESGEIICSSKSLHLYEYVWDFAKTIRCKG